MADQRTAIDLDHHSEEYAAESTERLAEYRSRCPVAWSEHHGGFWCVSNHELGSAAFRDWESFSNAKFVDRSGDVRGGIVIPSNPSLNLIPDEVDPPQWHGYRRLLNRRFAPAAIDELRPRIRFTTAQMIDAFIERGEADLVLDVANPIPAAVTLEMLNLPIEELELFALPFHEIVYAPAGSDTRRHAEQGFVKIYDRVNELVGERRRHPREDDFMSELIAADIDGEALDDDEIVRIVMQLLGGGIDTTTALLGSVFMYLDEHPELRTRLLDEPGLLVTATEEFMRFYSPIQAIGRSTTRELQFGGEDLGAHEPVLISIASMNRDHHLFREPDSLILDRMPNRHAGFGMGIHRCLGSNLARAMFQETLVGVLKRLPDYRVDRERAESYAVISAVAGWITIPCTFTPGSRLT
jgi:cytochrome P450